LGRVLLAGDSLEGVLFPAPVQSEERSDE